MVLREAFDYSFSRLDPTGAHIDPPSVAIYETILAKGPDWEASPMLASGWQVSSDRLRWTVRVRRGLRFHSGDVCDAGAIAAALEHVQWKVVDEHRLWYWDPVASVSATNPETLVFSLRHPYARLPSLLWGTHTAVHNEVLRLRDPSSFGTALADGTGPFRLVSWSAERVIAERFADYPGTPATFIGNPGLAHLDRIEWISIANEADRLDALESGEVDCLHGPPLGEVDRLREDPRFRVAEHCQPSNAYLAVDWRRTDLGFDDARVRRALSLAIDRDALVADALAGHGWLTFGPLPPGDEFHDPEIELGRSCSPDLAERLLDEAGHPRREGGTRLEFECLGQDDESLRRVAYGVRDHLARIGVRVRLRFVRPFADFYEAAAAGPAASISKWLWQDPMDAIIGFASTRGQPFPNWQFASVPALDRAFESWLRAETRTELTEAASVAQRVFADELPTIPLLTPADVWVWSRDVRGFRPFAANLYPFYQDVRSHEPVPDA